MNDREIIFKASTIRKKLGEDESSPVDIFALVQAIPNLTIVFLPMGQHISGACLKNIESAVIAINSSMSLGRQRFTLAHELYHFYYDENDKKVVCSKNTNGSNEIEKTADIFASYFLAPPNALYQAIQDCMIPDQTKLSLNNIIKLEQYFGLSHQAMLIRLSQEGFISSPEIDTYQGGIINQATRLGYDATLYRPSPKEKEYFTLGHYISLTENLLQEDKISYGKYEELLLDAFREDIVFGDDDEGGELLD